MLQLHLIDIMTMKALNQVSPVPAEVPGERHFSWWLVIAVACFLLALLFGVLL